MRVGTQASDKANSRFYEPLRMLFNNKYYMYASGGMYALSAEAVQLLVSTPVGKRQLAGTIQNLHQSLSSLSGGLPHKHNVPRMHEGGSW